MSYLYRKRSSGYARAAGGYYWQGRLQSSDPHLPQLRQRGHEPKPRVLLQQCRP